uniref:Uncharacterized protein LOC114336714 isoform X1 n=1 Tax=Diabrotica virgifera virgifera TaxID=50390 RepID=A0A6P7G7C5_DIAVI
MFAFIFLCLLLQTLTFPPTLGRDADQNEYPLIVAVESCNFPVCYPQCAGVVLSKSWILTLGSCAYVATNFDHYRVSYTNSGKISKNRMREMVIIKNIYKRAGFETYFIHGSSLYLRITH